jgi:hypothetical protein
VPHSFLVTAVTDENASVIEEIRRLLDPPEGESEPSLARVEDTLTVGYARAMALEAECRRIERRIGEVAAEIGRGANGAVAEELSALGQRMSSAEGTLTSLRSLLAELRVRASGLRAGASTS